MHLKQCYMSAFLFPAFLLLAGCLDGRASNESKGALQRQIDKLVFVEGGTFMMGDVGYTDGNGQFHYFTRSDRAHPAHQVTLSNYSVQAYEVTFGEFDEYMRIIGEEIVRPDRRNRKHAKSNYPAKWMTWHQARGYCRWLGERLGYPMDLPTEAQWEYAARSRGKAVAFATDNGLREKGRNFRDSKKVWHPMPVGSWPPNPLGLYDMSGNVHEWTMDWWYGYREEPRVDPNNHEARKGVPGRSKIVRGGGVIGTFTVYNRKTVPPDGTGAGVGVRCVVNHPLPLKQIL